MISPQFHVLNEATGAAHRLWQFIDDTEVRPEGEGDMSVSLANGLVFENVAFSYPARPDLKVLKGVNFRLNPGETLAVVGGSGSGI